MSSSGSHEEFRIVGAGPAGLAAAITLARAGRRVVVHEAAAEVGSRFQGDHQGLENLKTRDDVLDCLRGTELARSQCNSIRLPLLKIGAVSVRNSHRIRFLLLEAFPLKTLSLPVAARSRRDDLATVLSPARCNNG